MQRRQGQVGRVPKLPADYWAIAKRIRPALRDAKCALVPPLIDEDLVGLAVLTLADAVLGGDIPAGTVRSADLLLRARFAMGTVVHADPDFLNRAGMLPRSRLAVPVNYAYDFAWHRFLIWWHGSLMPAFLRAERQSWRVDPTTRDGQLLKQLRHLEHESPLTADREGICASLADGYASLDGPEPIGVDASVGPSVLQLLFDCGAWKTEMTWRGRDGALRIRSDAVRDALLPLLELRRERPAREIEFPQHHPDPRALSPAEVASSREDADLHSQLSRCLDAAARDDIDRRDLDLIRSGELIRVARAREVGVTEGALRKREKKLAKRATKQAPPPVRALLANWVGAPSHRRGGRRRAG